MSNFYSAPLSKTQMLNAISEQSGLSRKDVTAVMDSLSSVIEGHLKPGAAGVFKMPGLMKISVVDKPATPHVSEYQTRSAPVRPWTWRQNQPAGG
ncbi:MAG: hypothetical protein Ct9H300mP14_04760 [Gammaproteobacteria bacterium]|nr:MAG: hypothetical protein Ct9H300mP14_04760 [Gammaproteobacteria bacterium]